MNKQGLSVFEIDEKRLKSEQAERSSGFEIGFCFMRAKICSRYSGFTVYLYG